MRDLDFSSWCRKDVFLPIQRRVYSELSRNSLSQKEADPNFSLCPRYPVAPKIGSGSCRARGTTLLAFLRGPDSGRRSASTHSVSESRHKSSCGLRKLRLQTASIRDRSDRGAIRCQADRIQREGRRLVLHFQRILINPHRDLFSSQSILSEKLPMLEPDIAMAINLAGKLGRVQRPRKHVFGNGTAQHSTQHRLRAMSSVLALAVGKMVLHVVVVPPGLMGLLYLRPGPRVGEGVIS